MAGDSKGGSPLTRESIAERVRLLGVDPGQVLLVHAGLRRLGWICGGAVAVVQALFDVLGTDGTLVVPTHTADNRDPSLWKDPAVPESWWPDVREHLPAFDPRITPSHRMGALAEVVRTWPGALRSAHPQTSFAAVGPAAQEIVSNHALDCHLGERSPLGRLFDLDASVLLLGVGWESCTAFHLAEYRMPEPARRTYSCVVQTERGRAWMHYQDVNLDQSDFTHLGRDFEHESRVRVIEDIAARLFRLRVAVCFAKNWMSDHRRES